MNKIAFLNLSIALYLFFRYLRASKSLIIFFFSLFFIGLGIFESRNDLFTIVILFAIALAVILITLLKEKKHPVIMKLQQGYKPAEIILHSIIFFIFIFLSLLIFYKR
jgi:hypothetical protein